MVAPRRSAERRRRAGPAEQVLGAVGDAVQRSAVVAGGELGVEFLGARERLLAQQRDDAEQLRVEALQPVERELGEPDRRDLALAQQAGEVEQRREGEVGVGRRHRRVGRDRQDRLRLPLRTARARRQRVEGSARRQRERDLRLPHRRVAVAQFLQLALGLPSLRLVERQAGKATGRSHVVGVVGPACRGGGQREWRGGPEQEGAAAEAGRRWRGCGHRGQQDGSRSGHVGPIRRASYSRRARS